MFRTCLYMSEWPGIRLQHCIHLYLGTYAHRWLVEGQYHNHKHMCRQCYYISVSILHCLPDIRYDLDKL